MYMKSKKTKKLKKQTKPFPFCFKCSSLKSTISNQLRIQEAHREGDSELSLTSPCRPYLHQHLLFICLVAFSRVKQKFEN